MDDDQTGKGSKWITDRASRFVWQEGDFTYTPPAAQNEGEAAEADTNGLSAAEIFGNTQTASDIIENLGNEMDLMQSPQEDHWKAYLTTLAYAKLKAAGYIYERGGEEFIKVWDNHNIPFIIHMRFAGVDDTLEEGGPGAYGCRRELEKNRRQKMKTWWLAIDTQVTSYNELKNRKVVAQGYGELGDLRTLCALAALPDQKNLVKSVVRELAKLQFAAESKHIYQAEEVIWNLLQIRRGDLIVGIEGTKVRGICQVSSDAAESYIFDSSRRYVYAQTVCSTAQWIDWDVERLGIPPTPSGQGILGVKGLVAESEQVTEAWRKFQS